MSEPVFSSTVSRSLYSERFIFLGTFIGGPLVGGYMLANNFKTFGAPVMVTRTWLVVIAMFIFALATSFVPALDNVPSLVFSAMFCIAGSMATRKWQGAGIEAHRAEGGRFYGTGRVVVIVCTGLVIMLAFIFGLAYILETADQ